MSLFQHFFMLKDGLLNWNYVMLLQAFAWFSDLLVEHAEIFWSLFAVDMDQVLAEQPPDTWDAFPLFQILNDYLRSDGNNEWKQVRISDVYYGKLWKWNDVSR